MKEAGNAAAGRWIRTAYEAKPGGRCLAQVCERIRGYLLGWKGYFQFAQTPKVFRGLDEWIRHRLRALQLKHWKRGTVIYRELRARGMSAQTPGVLQRMVDDGG